MVPSEDHVQWVESEEVAAVVEGRLLETEVQGVDGIALAAHFHPTGVTVQERRGLLLYVPVFVEIVAKVLVWGPVEMPGKAKSLLAKRIELELMGQRLERAPLPIYLMIVDQSYRHQSRMNLHVVLWVAHFERMASAAKMEIGVLVLGEKRTVRFAKRHLGRRKDGLAMKPWCLC